MMVSGAGAPQCLHRGLHRGAGADLDQPPQQPLRGRFCVVPARDTLPPRSGTWSDHDQALASLSDQRKVSPVTSILCRMTAIFLATATLAFLKPTRLARRVPQ